MDAPGGRGADEYVRTTVPTPTVPPARQTAITSPSTSLTATNVGSFRDTGTASGVLGGGPTGLRALRGGGTRNVRRRDLDACRTVAQGTRRPAVHQDRGRSGIHSGRAAAGQPGHRDPGPAAADGDRSDRGGPRQEAAADRRVE